MHAPEDRLYADFQRTGDPGTLGEVYDLVSAELLHVALHLTGHPADAEDLLQSTFIVAIERAAEFDTTKRVRPWLMGILANRARLLRARAARQADPERVRVEQSADAGPVERLEGLELDERLDEALQRVPKPFRTVLILRLRHGMSAVEIAHALGRPPGTVRSQMARGLEVLKRELPSSIVGASLAALVTQGRGLAAVREAIVAHATSVQPALAAAAGATAAPAGSFLLATTGALAVKNVTLGLVCAGLAATGLFSLLRTGDTEGEALIPTVVERRTSGELQPLTGESPAELVAATSAPERRDAAPPTADSDTPAETPSGSGDVVVHAVWEADGSPAPDVLALLTYRRAGAPFLDERILRTDARGIARFAAVPAAGGTVQLLRGRMRNLAFDPDGTTDVTLAMPVGLVVEGEVVDELDRPIPGAEIWLSQRWSSDKGHIIAETGAGGRFELASITSDHFIGAQAPGRGLSYVQSARGKPGDRVPMRIVLATEGGRIRGVVIGPDSRALVGAEVRIGERDAQDSVMLASGVRVPGPPLQFAWTDLEGAFEIDCVPVGRAPVKIRAPGFATWSQTIDVVPEGNEVRAQLVGETVVTGRVATLNGQPVAGAHIHTPTPWRFGGSSGFSGADGSFTLRGLGPGETTLIAEHAEHGRTELSITLGAGESFHWDPVLQRTPRIFGRLVDEFGNPLPGRAVLVRDEESGGQPVTESTDATGGFSSTVDAGRSYVVLVNDVRGWRYFPRLIRRGVTSSTEPLVLVLASDSPGRGTIAGTVLAPDGSIPAGAQVDLWHREERIWKTFDVSGASGEFLIDGIPAGTVDLTVHAAEHPTERLTEVAVEAGETTDVGEIRFAVSGRVSGTIAGVADETLGSLELSVSGPDGGGTVQRFQREFESSALAPGRYRLSLSGDFVETVWRSVVISGGSDLIVELATQPAGMRRVRFDWPEGVSAPKWIGCTVTDLQGRFTWSGGAKRTGGDLFEARISAAPGRYTISAKTNNGLEGQTAFEIIGFEDGDEPVRLELRPE